jgi:hypothetical protein
MWVSIVGWTCAAGSVAFALVVRNQVAMLPAREIHGGFIDFFLPGPHAIAMLLWELGHPWLVLCVALLLVGKKRGRTFRMSDGLLVLGLTVGLVTGGLLVAELGQRGVGIGIPGVDHSWGRVFFF